MRPMRLFLIVTLLGFVPLHAKEETKAIGTVHLYGYLDMDWTPFFNAELLSVKPGLLRIRSGNQEIEHAGRFTVEQSATKKEKKWWQFGRETEPERVKMVILYDYAGMGMAEFYNADVYDKREGFIVIEIGGTRYTHCGRYTIER